MGNNVFANGREVSCKAADGKAICAFPDVCLSPPSPPAGPIPIPYPNTGFASDTADGSKTVKIGGKEAMLKNKSYFKKSTGDEPATKTLGMGVVTHQITGKVYFNSWSMDIKFEGENVVRHLDLTTHNHMSFPGNSPTWPYVDEAAMKDDPDDPCIDEVQSEHNACQEYKPYGDKDVCEQLGQGKPKQEKYGEEARILGTLAALDECLAARRCFFQPYDPSGCCHPQTPHHLIEASALHDKGRGPPKHPNAVPVAGMHDYNEHQAPCVCAEGTNQHCGTHGQMHTFQSATAKNAPIEPVPLSNGTMTDPVPATTYGEAKESAIDAFKKTFPESKCNEECMRKQLDNYHKQCGINDDTKIKAVATGQEDVDLAGQIALERSYDVMRARAVGGGGSR